MKWLDEGIDISGLMASVDEFAKDSPATFVFLLVAGAFALSFLADALKYKIKEHRDNHNVRNR